MEIPFENPCPGQANGLPAYFFTQAVHMLLASHCLIGNPEDYPKDFSNFTSDVLNFDFVVVGGGSTGSVIASRLSETKNWKVLLLEAGDNPTFESDIPGFGLSVSGRDLSWNFATNQSDKSCLGMEEGTCPIFQGKVLGGTSTINKMHYIRGNSLDYDEWENLGNDGWNYENLLKYFKKSERLDDDFKLFKDVEYDKKFEKLKKSLGDKDVKHLELSKMVVGKYHSKAGMMSVNHYAYDPSLSSIKKGLFAAAEEIGIPYVADVNGKSQIGIVRAMGAIHEGNRGNAAKAFLSPTKDRKNFFVLKNSTVVQLIFRDKKVTGVKFVRNGKNHEVSAAKEVILSAGAINSPRILQLSGIGPKKHLEKLGINVVRDLPGVGENLQAHLSFFGLPVAVEKSKIRPVTHLQKIDAMYQFISRGTGSFGGIGLNDIVAFVDTLNNSTVPNIEFLHYFNRIQDYYTLNELFLSLKFKNEIRDQFTRANFKFGILLIVPTLLRPKSRGRVELTSSNYKIPPRIISNFLENEEDVEELISGINFGMRLIKTKAFEKFQPEVVKLEIDGCKKFQFDTDEYWKCLVRHLTSSMHDVAGTCKMGPESDPFAVVDSKLRVRGMSNLRVADSSIMPLIVRGSTSVASVMIGEVAADFIKNDWKEIKHTEL